VSLEVTAPSLNAQNFTMLQDYEKSAMFLGWNYCSSWIDLLCNNLLLSKRHQKTLIVLLVKEITKSYLWLKSYWFFWCWSWAS
jgi:hypothetical protein